MYSSVALLDSKFCQVCVRKIKCTVTYILIPIHLQPIFVEHFESSGIINRMINWTIDDLVYHHYLRKENINFYLLFGN